MHLLPVEHLLFYLYCVEYNLDTMSSLPLTPASINGMGADFVYMPFYTHDLTFDLRRKSLHRNGVFGMDYSV